MYEEPFRFQQKAILQHLFGGGAGGEPNRFDQIVAGDAEHFGIILDLAAVAIMFFDRLLEGAGALHGGVGRLVPKCLGHQVGGFGQDGVEVASQKRVPTGRFFGKVVTG